MPSKENSFVAWPSKGENERSLQTEFHDEAGWWQLLPNSANTWQYTATRDRAEARGNQIVDLQAETPWTWLDGRDAAYRSLFESLPEGLSWLDLHFSADTDIRLMDDEASIRVGEYEFFRSGGAAVMMNELNLEPIGVGGWRQKIREMSCEV
ncbi:hypothetical protein ACLJYM_24870 [Rhizobium giardinii]|uniref:hypothetical protein n=1 Tax=Rhizobium giardinii TaxID=56731 RepID=UPI000DD5EE08